MSNMQCYFGTDCPAVEWEMEFVGKDDPTHFCSEHASLIFQMERQEIVTITRADQLIPQEVPGDD